MHQLANNKNNVNNYINKNYFVVINQCPPTQQQQPQASTQDKNSFFAAYNQAQKAAAQQ